jgi:hypothetical protein
MLCYLATQFPYWKKRDFTYRDVPKKFLQVWDIHCDVMMYLIMSINSRHETMRWKANVLECVVGCQERQTLVYYQNTLSSSRFHGLHNRLSVITIYTLFIK